MALHFSLPKKMKLKILNGKQIYKNPTMFESKID